MFGKNICEKLSSNPVTAPWFGGVWSSDKILEYDLRDKCATVVNEDSSNQPGSHWLAIIVDKADTIYFFDSFGRARTECGENIAKFAAKYKYVNSNVFRLQDLNSGVCGAYCVYFIYMQCLGVSLRDMVRDLPKSPKDRDLFVSRYCDEIL